MTGIVYSQGPRTGLGEEVASTYLTRMGAVGKGGLELSLTLLLDDGCEGWSGLSAVESQGGVTTIVSNSQVCPSGNQQLPNLDSVIESSKMERGPAIIVS